MYRSRIFWSIVAVSALVTGVASAQDAAPDEAEANSARVAERNPDDDITFTVVAGANLAYGNARTFALNLGSTFALRQGQHGFRAELGWIYGLAAERGDDPALPPNEFGPFDENANNFTGLARYDFFPDDDNAVFFAARFRNDPFASLEPRFQAQAGYLRNLMREENHRFWTELGVDFTFDSFGEQRAVGGLDMAGDPITSSDRGVGSVRVFFGYDNQINDVLTWRSGLEFLWGPLRTVGEGQLAAMRFEWVNQWRSKIEEWLQLSVDVTARLDSAPPGQVDPWNERSNQPTQMFDLIATLNLVGNFDLDGEPEAEPEPEPEPEPAAECPVCEECQVCEECEACEECAPVPPPAPPAATDGEADGEADAGADAEAP